MKGIYEMSSDDCDPPRNGRDWKTISANWASNQAVPTILLLLILVGLYFGTPQVVQQIRTGYEDLSKRNNESTERLGSDLKNVAERFDKDQERDFKVYSDSREKDDELREIRRENDRLKEKLQDKGK